MTNNVNQHSALQKSLTTTLGSWIQQPDDVIEVAAIDELLRGVIIDPQDTLNRLGIAASEALEKHPEEAVNICMRLSGSRLPETRCLSAVIISQLGRYSPSLWTAMIKHLALDDDRHVRDYAASVFDSSTGREGLIEFHPDYVWETLSEWAKDREYLVRRLTTRALLEYQKKHPEAAERLLALWDPLLTDPNEFVRRNLVSALRIIGRKNPDIVLNWLNKNLTSPNGHVATITTMTLDALLDSKDSGIRQEILDKLSAS